MLALCCLLLVGLLLLAQPGRSTLDTKEGHKTKTHFTSSMTLILIKTNYRDRDVMGGSLVNMAECGCVLMDTKNDFGHYTPLKPIF